MSTKGVNDPGLYQRMSVPYSDDTKAHAALRAFFADVSRLREQHRIAEVVTIAAVYVGTDENLVVASSCRGDFEKAVVMVAQVFGQYRKEILRPLDEMAGVGEDER